MSRAAEGSKGVRFADEQPTPSPDSPATATPTAATATGPALPPCLNVRLGFLLVGGIYCCDLLELQAAPATTATASTGPHTCQQPLAHGTTAPTAEPAGTPSPLPPEVRGLTAGNLSVACEQQPQAGGGGLQRLVLRLWAEQEGPFEAGFTLVLPPHQQEVSVHVSATVFSRKKGTPGLKPHVRCLGFSSDTDTEAASDWQGFA